MRSHRKPSGSQSLTRVAALNEANELRGIETRRAVKVEGEEKQEVGMEKTSRIWIPCETTA